MHIRFYLIFHYVYLSTCVNNVHVCNTSLAEKFSLNYCIIALYVILYTMLIRIYIYFYLILQR